MRRGVPVRPRALGGSILTAAALLLAGCEGSGDDPVVTAECRRGVLPPTLSAQASAAGERAHAGRAGLAALKECLEVEKARLETRKLDIEIQNAVRDSSRNGLLNLLLQNLTLLTGILAAIVAAWRYLGEKRKGREEDENARFQTVVASLGSEIEEARIGAAALLVTFLQPGYSRFYLPVFKLTVGYLVPGDAWKGRRGEGRKRRRREGGREVKPDPIDPLDQMLASVLKTAYPLALVWLVREHARASRSRIGYWLSRTAIRELSMRDRWSSDEFIAQLEEGGRLQDAKEQASTMLDAEGILLDGVYLAAAALPCGWFRNASFREIDGQGINFAEARLSNADFTGADLSNAQFSGAVMEDARFSNAILTDADLRGVNAERASFQEAILGHADFRDASLDGADFSNADFSVGEGKPRSTIELARTLKGAKFVHSTGLTDEQIEKCRKKGATVPGV
jgi:uncharacterized protein YjbI with pentapeptide repeats